MGKLKKKGFDPKHKKSAKSRNRFLEKKVDNETVNYYIRISTTLEGGFESEEEKGLFLQNVFSQLENEEHFIFMHPALQGVLVHLMEMADLQHASKLLTFLRDNSSELFNDNHSRKVMGSLLLQIPEFISQTKTDSEVDKLEEVKEIFLSVCESLKGDIENVFVVKTVMQILAGQVVMETKDLGNTRKKKSWSYSPPPEFTSIFHEMCEEIFNLKDIQKIIEQHKASMVLTHMFKLLHKADNSLCQTYIQKYLELSTVTGNFDRFMNLVTDSRGSFLMQTIIDCSSDEVYREMYDSVCKGNLLNLAVNANSNFVLESLILRVQEKEQFEEIFTELKDNFEDILAFNHIRVITSFAKTSYRLKTCQMKFVKEVMKAFHCKEPEERRVMFVPLVASLTTYEIYNGIEDGNENEQKSCEKKSTLGKVNIHGSLLLQTLLEFKNPKYVINSLLHMTLTDLNTLSCDPSGSRVLEMFFKSTTVSDKNKFSMIEKLQDILPDIACNSCGSWIIETIWKSSPLQQKTLIAKTLSKYEKRLCHDPYGKYIHKSCAISTFLSRRKDWTDLQNSSQKKRKLFQDILESPKSKKRKKTEDG